MIAGPRFLSQLTIKKSSCFCRVFSARRWVQRRLERPVALGARTEVSALEKLRVLRVTECGISHGGGSQSDLIYILGSYSSSDFNILPAK